MKSIGKYEVVEEIGSSVAGTSYRVRDNFRNRELVLKVLHPIPTLPAAATAAFCREIATSAELLHRNIVKVLDLGEVDGQVYIATELLSGTSLHRHLADNPGLTLADKLGLLAQVCEGLAFAHSREIAHGNIKPSNILVSASNDVTILDFGTGKWQTAILASGSRPENFQPHYLAPEQILNQSFDCRSDIFSTAVLAYELAAGRYPFPVPAGLVPREIVHSEPEPLRKLNAEIPEELEQILAQALQKNPDQRLQRAEELASALYHIAGQMRRSAAEIAMEIAAPRVPATLLVNQPSELPAEFLEVPTAFAPPPIVVASPAPIINGTGMNSMPSPVPFEPPVPMEPPPSPPVEAEVKPIATDAPAKPLSKKPPVKGPSAPKQARPATFAAKALGRHAITLVAGVVLTVYLVLNFISHQGLSASQNNNAAKPSAPQAAVPEASSGKSADVAPVQNAAPEVAAPPVEPPPATPPPDESVEQLRKVKALWESGQYRQAMRRVDEVLASNPWNAEARVWKDRIRAAQAAEAAIK